MNDISILIAVGIACWFYVGLTIYGWIKDKREDKRIQKRYEKFEREQEEERKKPGWHPSGVIPFPLTHEALKKYGI